MREIENTTTFFFCFFFFDLKLLKIKLEGILILYIQDVISFSFIEIHSRSFSLPTPLALKFMSLILCKRTAWNIERLVSWHIIFFIKWFWRWLQKRTRWKSIIYYINRWPHNKNENPNIEDVEPLWVIDNCSEGKLNKVERL